MKTINIVCDDGIVRKVEIKKRQIEDRANKCDYYSTNELIRHAENIFKKIGNKPLVLNKEIIDGLIDICGTVWLKDPHIEDTVLNIISKCGDFSYEYATEIGSRFPEKYREEAEFSIANMMTQYDSLDGFTIIEYAERYLPNGVWDHNTKAGYAALNNIAGCPHFAYSYAMDTFRWPEQLGDISVKAEVRITQEMSFLAEYTNKFEIEWDPDTIQGMMALARFSTKPMYAYKYAKNVLGRPFNGDNLEKIVLMSIAMNPKIAYLYAKDILGTKWQNDTEHGKMANDAIMFSQYKNSYSELPDVSDHSNEGN